MRKMIGKDGVGRLEIPTPTTKCSHNTWLSTEYSPAPVASFTTRARSVKGPGVFKPPQTVEWYARTRRPRNTPKIRPQTGPTILLLSSSRRDPTGDSKNVAEREGSSIRPHFPLCTSPNLTSNLADGRPSCDGGGKPACPNSCWPKKNAAQRDELRSGS